MAPGASCPATVGADGRMAVRRDARRAPTQEDARPRTKPTFVPVPLSASRRSQPSRSIDPEHR